MQGSLLATATESHHCLDEAMTAESEPWDAAVWKIYNEVAVRVGNRDA